MCLDKGNAQITFAPCLFLFLKRYIQAAKKLINQIYLLYETKDESVWFEVWQEVPKDDKCAGKLRLLTAWASSSPSLQH